MCQCIGLCVCVRVHTMLRDEKLCIRTHSWFILDIHVVSLQVEDSSTIIKLELAFRREILLLV